MKIAILGAGPSGMMAAHAASDSGHEIQIFDKAPDKARRNSGIFYLHSSCNLPLKSSTLRQNVLGSWDSAQFSLMYGEKVYGQPIAKTSIMDAFSQPEIEIYNAGQAIEFLWDMYGEFVNEESIEDEGEINRKFLRRLNFDKVVCTIPADYMFRNYLKFQLRYTKLWMKVSKSPDKDCWAMYNVNPQIEWYRCSSIFGQFVMEYAKDFDIVKKLSKYDLCDDPAISPGPFIVRRGGCEVEDTYFPVKKVVSSNVNFDFPGDFDYKNVCFTGRYGAWDKTCLIDKVYSRTRKWLTD